jgi:methionyl-tRNA synthetase
MCGLMHRLAISTKEWALREGKDWEPYWKDQETKLVHFIGKDNIFFIA